MTFQKATRVEGDWERGFSAAKKADAQLLEWAREHITAVESENARLRATLAGVECALARDENIDGAMKLIVAHRLAAAQASVTRGGEEQT